MTPEFRLLLHSWESAEYFRALDVAFAEFLCRENGIADQAESAASDDLMDRRAFLGLLVSHLAGQGHVCLDLSVLQNAPEALIPDASGPAADGEEREASPLQWWLSRRQQELPELEGWPLLGSGCDSRAWPLIRYRGRLYLHRYWKAERFIEHFINQRLVAGKPGQGTESAARLKRILGQLFNTPQQGPDYQAIACAIALRQSFSVITGGPGTGKTTTVVKLLAAKQALALSENRPLSRIRLAAPTGKAAARLNESISQSIDALPLADLHPALQNQDIPSSVTTLHSLLGSRGGSRAFLHNARNLLAVDTLVIDEASMIDLELMAAVIEALPAEAQLILLGDKDQLASVEAGALMGALCEHAEQGNYREETVVWVRQSTACELPDKLQKPDGLARDQAIAMLRVSHRFGPDSGIGQLAGWINEGKMGPAELARLQSEYSDDISVCVAQAPADKTRAVTGISRLAREGRLGADTGKPPAAGYEAYLKVLGSAPGPQAGADKWDQWAQQVLQAFNRVRILCAVQMGPFGVDAINEQLSRDFFGYARGAGGGWFPGRPVMVTRNDYALGLMNGDIGIALERPVPQGEGVELRVVFPGQGAEDALRWISPGRLASVQTVFAMTVHKSQGSEFEHTILVLPDRLNPVLTRELLYTGVTRARRHLTLMAGHLPLLGEIAARRIRRASGLFASEDRR